MQSDKSKKMGHTELEFEDRDMKLIIKSREIC